MLCVSGIEMTTRELATGTQFGKYHIVRQVGEGAFGVVYEAVLPGPMGFTKRVAIKRIHTYLVEEDPKFVQSMINEARIGGLLHHANIVDILEFGHAEDDWYIAMEFVDGISLAEVLDLCRRRSVLMPRFSVVELAMQVCRGLQYAHAFGDAQGQPLNLVHRDIKPSNVMLDATGTVKLCDFGIAKATTNLYMTTASATIKGTPRYMSPEQITADQDLDARSDVFSLGALLFEVMTGRVLYPETSLAALLHAILYDDLGERLDEAEVAFPGCRPLLARALARKREDRYPDMLALVDDLRTLDRAYPAEAEMSQVVRHLLEAVEQSEARAAQHSADATASLMSAALSEGGAPHDGTPAFMPSEPMNFKPPPASSSGWGEFTAAFFDSEPGAARQAVEPRAFSAPATPPPEGELPAEARLSGQIPEAAPAMSFPQAATVALASQAAAAEPPSRSADVAESLWDEGPPATRRWLVPAIAVAGLLLVALIVVSVRPWAERTPAGRAEETTASGAVATDDPTREPSAALSDVAPIEAPVEVPDEQTPAPVETVAPPVDAPRDEEAAPEAPTEAAPATQRAPGSVSLSVKPWADIYVDGERVESGNALRAHPVSGGVHHVKAICSAVEYRIKEYTITVDGDGVMLGCWDFEAMAECSRQR